MGAIEKISRAYKRDKAVRVLHEAHKKNQFTRLMPFRKFRLQKLSGLKESVTIVGDIEDSMIAWLPINASAAEIDAITRSISHMTQLGNVTVTAIAT